MGIKSTYSTHQILNSFEKLMGNLQNLLTQQGKKTNINNTKFGRYHTLLDTYINRRESSNLSDDDLLNLIGLVAKLNSLNYLFTNECKIEYDDIDLSTIVEGEANVYDENDRYNDKFFELSMAIRFAKSKGSSANINMKSICDVIINSKTAIECKYLHGINDVRDNLKKSLMQIQKRIDDGLATEGFSAVDVTNLCSKKRIRNYANTALKMYIDSFEGCYMSKEDIFYNCISNNNLSRSISSYATHEASVIVHKNLDFFRKDKSTLFDRFTDNIHAVVFQVSDSMWLEYEDFYAPIQIRGLEPVFNPNIKEEKIKNIMNDLKNLEVGI
ncbi:TPA: hypothetical protein H2V87_001335 [Salmonella enterica]|nr:hypothetical protein [Salmonella enterica]HAK8068537.1 hypothetical protein [Salmonella enterica]